ncbi:hypothetical protein FKW77_009371 [Venturia effusa]|uniref:Uncharacterized protein n=1 Tax=Venturia effusa TaxID=50376 RepID=A0A517L041_9PEZI|nr:hypothetical protein FKW77_009371 [Venturia effusa]
MEDDGRTGYEINFGVPTQRCPGAPFEAVEMSNLDSQPIYHVVDPAFSVQSSYDEPIFGGNNWGYTHQQLGETSNEATFGPEVTPTWNAFPCTWPGCVKKPGDTFFLSEDELHQHRDIHHATQSPKVTTPGLAGAFDNGNQGAQDLVKDMASGVSGMKRSQRDCLEPRTAEAKSRRRIVDLGSGDSNEAVIYDSVPALDTAETTSAVPVTHMIKPVKILDLLTLNKRDGEKTVHLQNVTQIDLDMFIDFKELLEEFVDLQISTAFIPSQESIKLHGCSLNHENEMMLTKKLETLVAEVKDANSVRVFKKLPNCGKMNEELNQRISSSKSAVIVSAINPEEDELVLRAWNNHLIFQMPEAIDKLPVGERYSASLVRQNDAKGVPRPAIRFRSSGGQDERTRSIIRAKISALCKENRIPDIPVQFSTGTTVRLARGRNNGNGAPAVTQDDNQDDPPSDIFRHHRRYWGTPGMGASIGMSECSHFSATLGGYIMIDGTKHILSVDHFIQRAQSCRKDECRDSDATPINLSSPSNSDVDEIREALDSRIDTLQRIINDSVLQRQQDPDSPLEIPLGQLAPTLFVDEAVSGELECFNFFRRESSRQAHEFALGTVVHRCVNGAMYRSSLHPFPFHRMDWSVCSVLRDRRGDNLYRFGLTNEPQLGHLQDERRNPHGIGPRCEETANVKGGDHVHYVGQTSGFREGTVNSALILVKDQEDGIDQVSHEWGILVDGAHDALPIDFEGDSGAWIVREDNTLVGLLWGWSDRLLLFTPIQDVFADIKRQMHVREVGLPPRRNPRQSVVRICRETPTKKKHGRIPSTSSTPPTFGEHILALRLACHDSKSANDSLISPTRLKEGSPAFRSPSPVPSLTSSIYSSTDDSSSEAASPTPQATPGGKPIGSAEKVIMDNDSTDIDLEMGHMWGAEQAGNASSSTLQKRQQTASSTSANSITVTSSVPIVTSSIPTSTTNPDAFVATASTSTTTAPQVGATNPNAFVETERTSATTISAGATNPNAFVDTARTTTINIAPSTTQGAFVDTARTTTINIAPSTTQGAFVDTVRTSTIPQVVTQSANSGAFVATVITSLMTETPLSASINTDAIAAIVSTVSGIITSITISNAYVPTITSVAVAVTYSTGSNGVVQTFSSSYTSTFLASSKYVDQTSMMTYMTTEVGTSTSSIVTTDTNGKATTVLSAIPYSTVRQTTSAVVTPKAVENIQHQVLWVRSSWPLWKVFIGGYFPVLLAVLFKLFWTAIYAKIKLIEPFMRMARPEGSIASDTLHTYYLSSYLMPDALFSMVKGHWLIFWSAVVYLAVGLLAPLGSEVLFMDTNWNCPNPDFSEMRKYNPCWPPKLSVDPVMVRFLQGLLVFVAIMTITLMVMVIRTPTGLYSDPSSIGAIASLTHHPEVLDDFRKLDDEALLKDVRRQLGTRKYRLDDYQRDDGTWRYGFVPVSPASTTINYDWNDENGVGSQNLKRTKTFSEGSRQQAIWDAVSDGSFTLLLLATMGILIAYFKDSGDNAFNRFFNSNSFGPRFVMASLSQS